MAGIDEAADAFSALINPVANAPAPKKAAPEEAKPTERMFQDNVEGPEDVDGPEDDEDEDFGDEDDDPEADEEGADYSEGDEDPDEESNDEEEASAKIDDGQKVTVKVDGEELEVPLKEALEGYIRTKTFHSRLNQLREAATTVEQEAVKVAKNRDKYSELLDTLTTQLDSLVPKEPDWDKLAEQDPRAAYDTRVAWDKFKEQRAALESEKARIATEKEAESTENLRKYVVAERGKMLSAVPDWNDSKIRERDQKAMSATAKAVGFSDDEISTVYDHRMMRVLLKAAKYDRLMARKPKVSAGHSKLTKHGPGDRGTAPKADVGAHKRLSSRGDLDSAADVFASVLNNERRASRKR